MKSSLRRTLEQIAHDAGLVGVIEAIPDHILEEAFLNFLNCPDCAGDGEAATHGHDADASLSDVVAALRLPGKKKR